MFTTIPLTLLAWCGQVIVLTAAGALAATAITHPKARLLMWQGLLLAMLLLPVAEPWKSPPVEVSPVATAAPAVTGQSSLTIPDSATRQFQWRSQDWLWLIAAGAVFRLLWVGAGFLRLRRYREQARLLSEPPLRFASDAAAWYASESVPGPVTYGWRRPVILLPAKALELPADLCEAIQCHELIHVRRGDWVFVLAETLVRSALWFHPAIWFVLGRIQLAREQAVDQEVVNLLQNRDRYLDALVAVAEYQLQPDLAPAPLFLRKRHLLARVESVIKEINMTRSRIVTAATVVCSVLPVAVGAAMWLFPFMSEAQTSPDSPGVTVDAGAVLLHRAPVRAPEGAAAAGTVTVEATLDAKGEVTDARVVSGPQELRRETLASVLQWHYKPGPTVAEISIRFGAASPGATAPARIVATKGAAVPTATTPQLAAVITPGTPQVLNSIQFPGLSAEAEQELRSQLKVREGDVINPSDIASAMKAVRDYDSHLSARFTVGNGGATTLQIAAGNPAGPGGRGGPTFTGTSAATALQTAVAQLAAAPLATGVYRPGGDISNPVPISRVEPIYTEEARQAKWQGTVLLSMVIDENGVPQNIQVIKPLGMGLDQKAIESASQWRFKPGMKSGVAVPVQAQIEISFRLL